MEEIASRCVTISSILVLPPLCIQGSRSRTFSHRGSHDLSRKIFRRMSNCVIYRTRARCSFLSSYVWRHCVSTQRRSLRRSRPTDGVTLETSCWQDEKVIAEMSPMDCCHPGNFLLERGGRVDPSYGHTFLCVRRKVVSSFSWFNEKT